MVALAVVLTGCDVDGVLNKIKGDTTAVNQATSGSSENIQQELSEKQKEFEAQMTVLTDELDEEFEAKRALEEARAARELAIQQANQSATICVNPELVAHLKFAIADEAVNALIKQKSVGIEWLQNTDINAVADHIHNSSKIELQYIKELPNGGCSATAVINYSNGTQNPVSGTAHYLKHLNNPYDYSSQYIANVAKLFDINQFNLDNLKIIDGNTYSGKITYAIQETYTETGESQQSYAYDLGQTSNFLATLTAFKEMAANNKAEKAEKERKKQEQDKKAHELAKKEFFENGPQWKTKPNLNLGDDYEKLEELNVSVVMVELTIQDDGRISNVELDTTGNDELDNELKNRIKRGRFYPFAQFKKGEIKQKLRLNIK